MYDGKNIRFVDLFAGCGGLSLGLLQAGLHGLFAIEKDQYAFETLQFNFLQPTNNYKLDWPKWVKQRPWEIDEFISEHGDLLKNLKGKVELLVGGPPCQGFSWAGRREVNDPRNYLVKKYMEFAKALEPEFLLLENVDGITNKRFRKNRNQPAVLIDEYYHSDLIQEMIDSLGYDMYDAIVSAENFGVPQKRSRYFAFGIRKGLVKEGDKVNPLKTLSEIREEFLQDEGLKSDKHISVKEAISDLEIIGKDLIECEDSHNFKQIGYTGPKTEYQQFLHNGINNHSMNSMRIAKHRDNIMYRFKKILDKTKEDDRRGISINKALKDELGIKKHTIIPLASNKPAPTLTTLPDDLIHYSEPRILTVRECARLQSFPDWFFFRGKYTTGGKLRKHECPRYTQVGNAVPPLLAKAFGIMISRIRDQLNNHK